MTIRPVDQADATRWIELACELWRDASPAELRREFDIIQRDGKPISSFLYWIGGQAVAFITLSIRTDHVEGSSGSPTAYLEGIYVVPECRRQGIAKEMIRFAEKWAKDQGCSEFGSDAELNNRDSQNFHHRMGFNESNRLVTYIKQL